MVLRALFAERFQNVIPNGRQGQTYRCGEGEGLAEGTRSWGTSKVAKRKTRKNGPRC
jgi:hypothetical protein